jgi:hypothetical protein
LGGGIFYIGYYHYYVDRRQIDFFTFYMHIEMT